MPEVIDAVTDPHQGHNPGSEAKNWLAALGIGTALITGAVILSPYVIPLLHVGNTALATQTFTAVHGVGLGTGLVGAMNSAINTIPFVGAAIAKGGIASALATGVTGIGGVLLGQFIEKRENGKSGIKWGKVVKTAALITSALIAMPAILSGITMGIVYCSAAFSGLELGSAAISFLTPTLGAAGSMGAATAGLSGVAAILPHVLTCGMPIIAAGAAWFMGKNKAKDDTHSEHQAMLSKPVPEYDSRYADGTVRADVEINNPTVANQPCAAKLILTNAATGQPVTPDELAIVHTKKIHLFVADSSLKDYHHIHPEPTDEPGVYSFSFTPKTSNNYSAWADITTLKDSENYKLKTELPSASGRNIPARISTNTSATSGGLSFQWNSTTPLTKGEADIVSVTVTDTNGRPVTDLEPVIGAFAHLVGFSADGKSLIHTHPLEESSSADERGGPKLRFHVEPENAGATQFYLQVRRNGQDIFAPFGQVIKAPSRMSETYASHHQHGASPGYAM